MNTEPKIPTVRFAPSPTGFLHIGGARTALFNWMYARSLKGKFILRIEDTDQQRSSKEFEEEILQSMKWLGMDWDELHYQSKRFDIYREYAQKLLADGKAYQDGEAIVLKIPQQEVKLYDLIRDEITFDTATIKDQVLMKSDGSPTYSFACVIDDALMGITSVIRGEDHISNTPKQLMIYHALGFKPPKYAHLPLIMGTEGRLSKRTGAVAVSDYRKQGFLPEAIMNYLMLLGWSPGNNEEVIDMQAAVKKFSIKKINKAAAIFSMEKLRWINNQYIRKIPADKLVELLTPLLKEKYGPAIEGNTDKVAQITELYKGRASTLNELIDWTGYFFVDEPEILPEDREKYLEKNYRQEFLELGQCFESLSAFDAHSVEGAYKQYLEQKGLTPKDLIHPLRVVLTGQTVGPSLFHAIEILGKEKTIHRLKNACT